MFSLLEDCKRIASRLTVLFWLNGITPILADRISGPGVAMPKEFQSRRRPECPVRERIGEASPDRVKEHL